MLHQKCKGAAVFTFSIFTGKDMASITPKLADISDNEVRTVLEKVY